MQQILNNVHNGIYLGRFRGVSSMGCSAACVESRIKNFRIAGADKTLILKLPELLLERPFVANLLDDKHVHQRSGSHQREAQVISVERTVDLLENSPYRCRNFVYPGRGVPRCARRIIANISLIPLPGKVERAPENGFSATAAFKHFKSGLP